MMSTYIVCAPVRHDGKRYSIGELIALRDEQALPLLKMQVIGLAVSGEISDATKSTPADTAPPAEAEASPAEGKAKPKSKAKTSPDKEE